MLKLPALLNIPSPFTSLARRLFSKRGSKPRDKRSWSGPEALEVRYVLAASMSAILVDGLLTVSDTAGADNSLTVAVDGDDLVITDDTEQFLSAPAGATLSNGDRTLTVPLDLITAGFTLNSSSGNDSIEFGPLELAIQGNLIVDGGAGTDELTFAGGTIELATGGLFATADQIYSGAFVTASGAVRLNATGDDLELYIAAPITAGADSALIADKMGFLSHINVGTHVLTIAPDSTGDSNDAIDIGFNDPISANTLQLFDYNLDLITAGTIVIGDANTGTIKVTAAIHQIGGSNIEVTTPRNIVFADGSSWLAQNGHLSFVANPTGTTAGNFTGIEVNNAKIWAGVGGLTLNGHGGASVEGSGNRGVAVTNGAVIQGDFGPVIIDGTGGLGQDSAYGVEINAATITAGNAVEVQITGVGGDTANGYGVWIRNGAELATGWQATIDLHGTGGDADGGRGVVIGGDGAVTRVHSAGGDITITGIGGDAGTGTDSIGVLLWQGGQIESTGAAKILINGAGGAGRDGSRGIQMLDGGTKITSAIGDILLIGQGGAGVHGFGIWVYRGAEITSTETAKITLNGTGGTIGGNDNGIMFAGFGTGGATVSSVNGDISLIGVGGDTLDGTYSRGIGLFEETLIESTGTADITINGTAGDGVNTLRGVEIGDSARVRTQHDGNIVITGQAGASLSPSVTYNEGVLIRDGAVIESTATAGTAGQIQINGVSGQGAGRDFGVRLTGDAHVRSHRGDITITGLSGSDNGDNNHGIFVEDRSTVESFDSAKITLDGTGRGGTLSLGVYILGPDSAIRSVNGDIRVTGQGGDGGHINIGVTVDYAAVIESTGTAKVRVHGTGGAGADGNHGVRLYGDGSFIRSAVGDIEVTGVAGAGTTDSNNGVILEVGGAIVSSGTAKIKVTGTAGTGTFHPGNGIGQAGVWLLGAGSKITSKDGDMEIAGFGGGSPGSSGNHGVAIQSGTVATSGTANVVITGTPGVGPVSFGMQLQSAAGTVAIDTSVGTGSVTLTSDALDIDFVSRPTSINAGPGAVTIQPKTVGTPINLGSVDTDGVLALADGELKRITAGTLIIGNSSAGTITVTADIATQTSTNLQLVSGGDLVISGGQINTHGGMLLLDSGATPDVVNPSHAGVDVSASTSTLGGDLLIAINGTAVDSGYTQFNAAGRVNLNGVQLQLVGSYIPTLGQTFVIVNNDSDDAVSGIFQGLPEGTNFLFNGRMLQISYVGGSGNDVALTTVNTPPVAEDGALTVVEDTPTNGTLIATDVESSSLTYSVVTPPQNGTVVINNTATGAFTYTPHSNYNGTDSFTFQASDGLLDSAPATVSINVEATNDAPRLELNGGPVTFSAKADRKNRPLVVLPNVTVTDPDESAPFKLGGGTLTVTLDVSTKITKNKVKLHDTLGTLISPTTIGAPPQMGLVEGKLIYTVQLHSTATVADVQSFLRGLTFSTKGPGLKVTPRAMSVRLTDAAGAPSNILQQTITVTK